MTLLRRAVTLPVVLLLHIAVLLSGPLLLVVTGLISAATRSSRPVRSAVLVLAYSVIELRMLARVVRGDVDWERLLIEVADTAYTTLRTVLDVPLVLAPDSAEPAGNPVIVLARHCGPGDSLFIAWLIAVRYRLRLHVVLKALLRVEPLLDVAGDHLPLCFVRRHHRGRDAIAKVAAGMTGGDALLLFPEGRNFSWPRWRQAVADLYEAGRYRAARLARRRTHTLPPRHGGTFAALAAAPTADVLVLAHTGFTDTGRDRPWWKLPTHRRFVVRTTLIPAARVPRTESAVTAWLEATWAEVDAWITENAPTQRVTARARQAS